MLLHNIWSDIENADSSYLKENWIFPFHFVLKLVSIYKFVILIICEICLEEKQSMKKKYKITTNTIRCKYLIEEWLALIVISTNISENT